MDAARLRKISVFSQLPEEELKRIAVLAGESSVHEGSELVRQGEFAYEWFAIEEGTAEVRRDGRTIAELTAGDVFGEVGVAEKELRNATVVATSPMRVIVFSRWDVKRLRKQLPDADEQIARIIQERH